MTADSFYPSPQEGDGAASNDNFSIEIDLLPRVIETTELLFDGLDFPAFNSDSSLNSSSDDSSFIMHEKLLVNEDQNISDFAEVFDICMEESWNNPESICSPRQLSPIRTKSNQTSVIVRNFSVQSVSPTEPTELTFLLDENVSGPVNKCTDIFADGTSSNRSSLEEQTTDDFIPEKENAAHFDIESLVEECFEEMQNSSVIVK